MEKGKAFMEIPGTKAGLTEERLKEYLLRLFQLFNNDSASRQEGSDGLNI